MMILRSMSRKRFEDIKKFIHFHDNNNLPAGDKIAKIRSQQDKVNASLQQVGVFAKDPGIDEQMVHTLVGTLQRCSFVASRSDLATKTGFQHQVMVILTNLRLISERVILRAVASLLDHKMCLLFFR